MSDMDSSLALAIEHGFTEEQWRAAKSIEMAIFGPYQWQNQQDRAAALFVRVLQALKEAEERARTQGPDYIVRHERSKVGGEPTIVEHKSGREK